MTLNMVKKPMGRRKVEPDPTIFSKPPIFVFLPYIKLWQPPSKSPSCISCFRHFPCSRSNFSHEHNSPQSSLLFFKCSVPSCRELGSIRSNSSRSFTLCGRSIASCARTTVKVLFRVVPCPTPWFQTLECLNWLYKAPPSFVDGRLCSRQKRALPPAP